MLDAVDGLAEARIRAAVHGDALAVPSDPVPRTRLPERQVALVEHPVVRRRQGGLDVTREAKRVLTGPRRTEGTSSIPSVAA